MKKYIRSFLFYFFSLWVLPNIISSVVFEEGIKTIATTALVLTIMNILIKPLINLLLLPVNILTLGLFRWLVNVITLYFTLILVPQFKIYNFNFPGFSYQGFVVPPLSFGKIATLILVSFILSLITTFLNWLVKK
ncbi:MAG: phage holin family protein [Microgenomates group bacterium]